MGGKGKKKLKFVEEKHRLPKFGDFCGQATVTYLIDVNHISLGNVVGHYGCPKAV